MGRQKEFAGMGSTKLSNLADQFVDIFEEEQELDEKKNKVSSQLLEAMTGAGKQSIRHRGRTISIQDVEAKRKLTVKKFNEKN